MANDQLDFDDIRTYVDQNIYRYKMMQHVTLFTVNLILFIIFSAVAIASAVASGRFADLDLLQKTSNPTVFMALALPMIGWMVGVILHGAALFLNSRYGERTLRGQLAMRAMGRKLADAASDQSETKEKPKREVGEQYVRLSDDGELIPDEQQSSAKAPEAHRSARG
jgi:hypothetical protein